MSTQVTPVQTAPDDPRMLRELITRTQERGAQHDVPSVVVGFAAPEGDRLFPDFVSYVESELRVEDSIFRLTRERALLFLTDVNREKAAEIVERLEDGFRRDFPTLGESQIQIRLLEMAPRSGPLAVRDVLPEVFGPLSA
jgi:hypothetical protein